METHKLSVFFDTNIILGYIKERMPSFYVVTESAIFENISFYINDLRRRGYDIEICLVDIVIQEITQQMCDAPKACFDEIDKSKSIAEKILGSYVNITISSTISGDKDNNNRIVKKAIDDFIAKNNIAIVEYKEYLKLEELVDKAVQKRYPFNDQNHKHKRHSAWKDTVIYSTIHAYQLLSGKKVIFCTNDSDFDDITGTDNFFKIKLDKNTHDGINNAKNKIDDFFGISDVDKIRWEVDAHKTELISCLEDAIDCKADNYEVEVRDVERIPSKKYKKYKISCNFNAEDCTVAYDSVSKLFSLDIDEDEDENDNI